MLLVYLNFVFWGERKELICVNRFRISAVLTYATFVASFASAIFSAAVEAVDHRFHVSTEVSILGITLYVSLPPSWFIPPKNERALLDQVSGRFRDAVNEIDI